MRSLFLHPMRSHTMGRHAASLLMAEDRQGAFLIAFRAPIPAVLDPTHFSPPTSDRSWSAFMVTSGVSQVERKSKGMFKTSDLRRAASLSSFAAREWLKGSQTLQTHCEPGTRS